MQKPVHVPNTSPVPVLQAEPAHTSGLFLPQNQAFQACFLLTYFSKAAIQFFLKLKIFLTQQREWRGAGKGLHALPAVPSLAVQWK